jgi:hypothetical protein
MTFSISIIFFEYFQQLPLDTSASQPTNIATTTPPPLGTAPRQSALFVVKTELADDQQPEIECLDLDDAGGPPAAQAQPPAHSLGQRGGGAAVEIRQKGRFKLVGIYFIGNIFIFNQYKIKHD